MTQQKFDIKLLEILICPITREKLSYDAAKNILTNESRSYQYNIINNMPNLLPDAAIKISSN